MTRIDRQSMAQWKPRPPTRESAAALKERVRANNLLLAELEARTAIKDKPLPPAPGPEYNLHFDAICKAVCNDFGVEREVLEGKGRHPRVIAARRALVWLARKRTLLSYPEIAASMGKTSGGHTTALEQCQAAVAMLDKPMHPETKETFAEYFARFAQQAWQFKPREATVEAPPKG